MQYKEILKINFLKMLFSQIGPFSRYHILYYGGQADIDLLIYACAQNPMFSGLIKLLMRPSQLNCYLIIKQNIYSNKVFWVSVYTSFAGIVVWQYEVCFPLLQC